MSIRIFISRWWQNRGFGMESRMDYDFLHDVIKERLPYYAYDELKQRFPNASEHEQRFAQLLFRLGNYLSPSEVVCYGNTTQLNKEALEMTLRTSVSSQARQICLAEGECGADFFSKVHKVSLLVMKDIDGVNAEAWKQIMNIPSITYDKRNVGIALFHLQRYPEHYSIL